MGAEQALLAAIELELACLERGERHSHILAGRYIDVHVEPRRRVVDGEIMGDEGRDAPERQFDRLPSRNLYCVGLEGITIDDDLHLLEVGLRGWRAFLRLPGVRPRRDVNGYEDQ